MGQSGLSRPVAPPQQVPPDLHAHSHPPAQLSQPVHYPGGGPQGGSQGAGSPGPSNQLSLTSSSSSHQQCGTYASGTSNLDSKKCPSRSAALSASRPLSTLKKRLIRGKRRSSKSYDHAQIFRDFVRTSGWNAREVSALVREYECLAALRELETQAESARTSANSARKDLAALFESKLCADITLLYRGSSFPAHRAVLCVRCPFFRELLNDPVTLGSQIVVEIDIPEVTLQLFNDLIRYLYTGELSVSHSGSLGTLLKLSEQFGIPNPLEQDLRYLLETGVYCDALLVFSNHTSQTGQTATASTQNLRHCVQGAAGDFCKWCSTSTEFACHKALLAARSRFLKAAILRQQRREGVLLQRNVKITLDRSVVPVKYSKVILFSIYQDNVDFASLLPAESMLQDLMEIYQISRLLEIDSLTQNCEDLIVELMTVENIVPVLNWSQQAHASQWVRRQAMNFLKEDFALVACVPYTLSQLPADTLSEVLDSDFVQASELEILSAILKWSENRNLSTTDSAELKRNTSERGKETLCRNSGKRSASLDLLRDTAFCEGSPEVVKKLIGKVRFAHILPKCENEVLQVCAHRGLLPPQQATELLKTTSQHVALIPANTPQRGAAEWGSQRPRLFLPYFEEAKAMLETLEHVCTTPCSSLPFGTTLIPSPNSYVTRSEENILDSLTRTKDADQMTNYLYDFSKPALSQDTGSNNESKSPDETLMVSPSEELLHQMRQREAELWSTPGACKTIALAPHKRSLVSSLLRLRVVREMGFPDETAQALKNYTSKSLPVSSTGTLTYGGATVAQAGSCKKHAPIEAPTTVVPTGFDQPRIRSNPSQHSLHLSKRSQNSRNVPAVTQVPPHPPSAVVSLNGHMDVADTLPREFRLLTHSQGPDHYSTMQASLAHLLASQANLTDLGSGELSLGCRLVHKPAPQPLHHNLHNMQSVHYSLARRKQRLSSGPQFLLRDDALPVSNLLPWTGSTHVTVGPTASTDLHKTPVHSLSSNRRLLSTFGGYRSTGLI